jgi:hypothetical protein
MMKVAMVATDNTPMAHNDDEAGNGWNPPHNLSLRKAQVIHENWLLMSRGTGSS